ncbi:MAG: carboxymuconolactone decarboxylase family protein [Acidimicrobiales bacterium]
MVTNHVERHRELSDGLRKMHQAMPQLMAAFAKMHGAAVADGALPAKTKELIALAISITSHCDGCISFHVHDALRAGATAAELEEAIGVAVLMGGGSAAVYGAEALEAMRQFSDGNG